MTRAKPVPETVTVHIPFHIVKRGGRKEMQLPEGASSQRRMDNTLVKALARGFRWKRMLESGEFTTIAELAAREGITPTYLARVLRLTLLAPELVEVILDGRQPDVITMSAAMKPFSYAWDAQQVDWRVSIV
jgi:Rad3-related DNA helicase